jgi:hypothetical protein
VLGDHFDAAGRLSAQFAIVPGWGAPTTLAIRAKGGNDTRWISVHNSCTGSPVAASG